MKKKNRRDRMRLKRIKKMFQQSPWKERFIARQKKLIDETIAEHRKECNGCN